MKALQYMLDTNTIIYARNKRPPSVLDVLLSHDPSSICISAITMAELEYGVYKSSKPVQNRSALMLFLSKISVLPFNSDAASEYGEIRHILQTSGKLIGANDMLIAAHAKALNLTLVTHNTGEFSRIPALKLEDWAV